MNIYNILSEVSLFTCENDYNPFDIVVTHGGALVLSGHRDETRDIDLWVSRDIWVNEIKKGGKPKSLGNGVWMISISRNIDIHIGWDKPEEDLRETWSGCKFLSERTLLKEYKKLNRNKDRKTIRMLEDIINVKYNLV